MKVKGRGGVFGTISGIGSVAGGSWRALDRLLWRRFGLCGGRSARFGGFSAVRGRRRRAVGWGRGGGGGLVGGGGESGAGRSPGGRGAGCAARRGPSWALVRA